MTAHHLTRTVGTVLLAVVAAATADEPVIEIRDGLPVAVYRAVLPAGADGEVSASGEDRWGNTTP